MKDCEKILNEMYWRMKVMVEEKEKGRDDLDEYGLNELMVLLLLIDVSLQLYCLNSLLTLLFR